MMEKEMVGGAGGGIIHRIGGGRVENLRLKPQEARLNPPGISVLAAPKPAEAAAQIRAAFPQAKALHEAAKTVGSTTVDKIRAAGFEIISNPTAKLPNHHRIIHPQGAAGFSEDNLRKLSEALIDTSEEQA